MQAYKGIEMFPGTENDANIYLIDEELLIDTGTGEYFREIKKTIADSFDTARIKTIINTNNHFDHAGGDKKFRDWLKAQIVIHVDDRKKLESGETENRP